MSVKLKILKRRKNWVKTTPAKTIVDESGNICYTARGHHSKILNDFLKLPFRRPLPKKTDSHRIKRLKP